MFESLRATISDLLGGRVAPAERRAVLADMKGAHIQAKMGVEDLREGVEITRRRLAEEREKQKRHFKGKNDDFDFDIDIDIDLDHLNDEMEKLGPEISEQMREWQRQVRGQMHEGAQEMREIGRDLQEQIMNMTRNTIQRAALLARGARIGVHDLGLPAAVSQTTTQANDTAEPDRAAIEAALARTGGVLAQAAQELGMSRQALYRRLERLGIKRD